MLHSLGSPCLTSVCIIVWNLVLESTMWCVWVNLSCTLDVFCHSQVLHSVVRFFYIITKLYKPVLLGYHFRSYVRFGFCCCYKKFLYTIHFCLGGKDDNQCCCSAHSFGPSQVAYISERVSTCILLLSSAVFIVWLLLCVSLVLTGLEEFLIPWPESQQPCLGCQILQLVYKNCLILSSEVSDLYRYWHIFKTRTRKLCRTLCLIYRNKLLYSSGLHHNLCLKVARVHAADQTIDGNSTEACGFHGLLSRVFSH